MNPNFSGIDSRGGFGGNGNNRKGSEFIILIIIAVLTVFFNVRSLTSSNESNKEEPPKESEVNKEKPKETPKDSSGTKESSTEEIDSTEPEEPSSETNEGISDSEKEEYILSNSIINLEYLPFYDGINKAIAVYTGFPDFDIDEFFNGKSFQTGWVEFTENDSLNRPQKAKAFITQDSLNLTEKELPSVSPEGFNNTKIDGKNAWRKAYLINPDFTKQEVQDLRNLTTLTSEAYSSTNWGVAKYEQIILDAVNQGESILYEVTPIYKNKNVVPEGIQLRATSYGSDALELNVFIYNVQDNLKINYLNGTVSKK